MIDPALAERSVAVCAGILLLTGVLLVWRHSVGAGIRLLAVQGLTLAALVALLAGQEGSYELLAVAVLVAALKGVVLPLVLARVAQRTADTDTAPMVGPAVTLFLLAVLTTLAYLVSRPMTAAAGPAAGTVPIGMSLVLYGFLLVVSRRHAISQLMGFLMLDNGIATVAFLISGGVPIVVELGVLLDVLLVVLVLQVLAGRMNRTFGGADLDDLKELHD